MKDDPREIDWAPKKIRKLEADVLEAAKAIDTVSEELAGTDKAVDLVNDRVSRLEDHLKTVRYRDWMAMGAQLEKLEAKAEVHTQLLETAQERLDSMTPYVELAGRVKALEAALQQYGVPIPSDGDVQIMVRHGGLFAEEYSAPIGGGVVPTFEQTTRDRITGIQAAKREQYERGLSTGERVGFSKGIETATDRFKAWAMARMWVDPEVMQEAIKAINDTADSTD